MDKRHPNPAYRRIYAAVRRIPAGKVATYGQVAELAGMPRHARQVGYALFHLEGDSDVPWHRVINARGMVSRRSVPGSEGLQRALLEDEGVVFNLEGRVKLSRFGYKPRSRTRPRRRDKETP